MHPEGLRIVDKKTIKKDCIQGHVATMLCSQLVTETSTVIPEPIKRILDKFPKVLAPLNSLPPNRPSHDHRIPLLQGSKPVGLKPYRHSHHIKNELEKIIQEMLNTAVIRPSCSAYSPPVVMVRKKDGTWRLCIDYRALNNITIKDKYPIPLVDDLFDELHGAKKNSKLDLRSGYHQIRVNEEDIHKTAFKTHDGHYEFMVMPFGLVNAPSTFQSLMNTIFMPYLRKFILVFFDDILIFSQAMLEHVEHVSVALQVLQENQLVIKLSKCSFAKENIKYLGHVISARGVAVDNSKVQAIKEWPIPTTPKALRGFLGLTGYYRKFIKHYGIRAKPLTDLLRKDSFRWSDKTTQTFERLKQCLMSPPVLSMPDFNKPFVVECDASGIGIGAVLLQDNKPIAFLSKALQGRNLNLSTYEKELLALLLATKKWSQYLLGRQFILKTDHQSLKYLLTQRLHAGIQEKWLAKLHGYDYVVEYKWHGKCSSRFFI